MTVRAALLGLALLGVGCASALPMPAENDWARITFAGIVRVPSTGTAGFAVSYSFALEPKRDDLARVDILDVSDPDPVMLLRGAPIGGDNGWLTPKVPLTAQNVPWLFAMGPTRKVFRFVLYTRSGDTSTLDQPMLFSAETKAFYRKGAS